MRPVFALFLLLLSFAPQVAARSRAVSHPAPFHIAAADEAANKALERGVPGLSIAVRKGDRWFSRAYGLFDREANVAASIHHEWQIGSVTKQFTAAAVMRLVERGVLHVEDRARQWLPELDARYDAITIEHLLTHTSGVAEYTDRLEDAWTPMTQQQILAMITARPLNFTPGTRFLYSNAGYFLLGMILERASSKPYARLLDELFFEPLSLSRTSYCGSERPSPSGYLKVARDLQPIPASDMSLLYSAGAICSTADDLIRWTFSLANGTAVSPSSYARMTTPANPPNAAYGYGLALNSLDNRPRIWHTGSVLGFQSHVAYYPDEDLTVVVLVNATDLFVDQATIVGEEVARGVR